MDEQPQPEPFSRPTDPSHETWSEWIDPGALVSDPSRLSHHEQMIDAQRGCVPCKLCGAKAVISDAGPGYGYYIECSNSRMFRASEGCLISERRLSGWAYNVRDWWNRLHVTQPPAQGPTQ